MNMIQEKYLELSWIHAYRDESATNAVRNEGTGIFISYSDS